MNTGEKDWLTQISGSASGPILTKGDELDNNFITRFSYIHDVKADHWLSF